MTVKNTFVAGTTIVASKMNENFLTLPYAMQGGSVTMTTSQNITFAASRFSVAPLVVATVNSNTGTASSVTVTSVTSSGATLLTWTGGTASTVSRTVYWTAMQMTLTNLAG
jgi:hypothetical protein